MGSSSSKFRKHLQNGDELAALKVYNDHSDLRKGLDPNSSYGDNYQHETPLHLAARHGMKSLLRIFLFEHGGNPNKTNGRKETALHCVCMEKHHMYFPVQRRRHECLAMILQWKGAELKDGVVEKMDLSALDESNNTALHYAAQSGLKACVELLVNHSCPLFIENKDNQTPCDSAESSGFNDIALYLESKMVFSNDGAGGEIDEVPPEIDSEEYSGLRAQDLQEAKDQLLVETADMLSIPLFTAEALLRNHEWSREMLLDAWMADPVSCCEKSGVTPPANLFSDTPVVAESLSTPTFSHPASSLAECDICTQTFQLSQEPVHMSCHQFCRECWEGYLNVKIKEGGVHDITCPGYGCNILVPVEVIESVVSRDMARRYLQFDIKAFVDSNPNIKWCPFPGCGRAVRLPEVVQGGLSGSSNSPGHNKIPADTSRAVDCGNGHYFCWECAGEAHEPCSCESLCKWLGEVSEIKPETLHNTEQETESAANCLWLVTNSKSCPQCKSPIQKNEGCNHMKCSKCKHDFCWVCLDQWKRHNSSTGGYFKCNRYEVSKKVEDTAQMSITEAEMKNSKLQELNKFVHYYTRYKNHENSYKLEEPLMKTAKEKMLKLAEAVNDLATAKDETKFVEEAVHKLLKSRRVLKYSYVYGYYLDGPPYRKIVFEFMQTELEECTEILSQMVNRLYLRTPRKKIIEQAQLCHRKRQDFLTAISKGLVPPETPPGLRKKRRRYSMDTDDEDMRKAILASIEDFDPENPWIVDASGRHTNIAAILDWPSDDSDDDTPSRSNKAVSLTDPVPEMCTRECCARPCAKNPRTGEYHKFCSLRCSRMHKQRLDDEPMSSMSEIHIDERMDILRALEMSRIQYLKEQGILNQEERSEGPSTSNNEQASREPTYTPSETLDIEIRHLLELTSLLDDNEETDLKTSQDQSGVIDDDKPFSLSRFGENQSTVVSRVPNKSVEDLYHPDCSGCQATSSLSPLVTTKHLHTGELDQQTSEFPQFDDLEAQGACGGVDENLSVSCIGQETENQSVDDFRVGGQILQKLLNMDAIEKSNVEPVAVSSSFGPIKDLSVSNIHINENDKMKNFIKKDFSNLTKSKPKVVERGNGRLFSANTPGEDEKVFTLLSPESDFSESSSSEVWGYRPQLVHEPKQMQTPETDSSVEGCSYADLPNQNSYYRHDDTLSETSPLIGEETKLMNLIGQSEHTSTNQKSLIELTENMLKMTLEMQNELETASNTEPSAQGSTGSEVASFPDDIISKNRHVDVAPPSSTDVISEAEQIDETGAAGQCFEQNVCKHLDEVTQESEKIEYSVEGSLESEKSEHALKVTQERENETKVLTDCEIIDLESAADALLNVDPLPVTVTTEEVENLLQISGELSRGETVTAATSGTEGRSTYV